MRSLNYGVRLCDNTLVLTGLLAGGGRVLSFKARTTLVTNVTQQGVHVVKRFPAPPAHGHTIHTVCLPLYGGRINKLHTLRCGMLARSMFAHS